jgi:hypothetical protein
MELHLLIYKIVSLRVICGGHEDSASVRNKLEAETQKRICKLKDLEHTTEQQAAQSLYELYEEMAKSRRAGAASQESVRRPKAERIRMSI